MADFCHSVLRRLGSCLALGILVSIPFSTVAATKFDPVSCEREDPCRVYVDGVITAKDFAIFQAVERHIATMPTHKRRVVVFLNSDGGDIEAAITIGKLLRRQPYSDARILSGQRCLSACVFVLAGALLRSVNGQVGIHRPFSQGATVPTYQENQTRFRALETLVRDFLKDMNLPATLYDEMMRVPPEKMRILSKSDLERFGLNQHDPVYLDVIESEQAQRFGLSKPEYLAHREVARRVCGSIRFESTGSYLLDRVVEGSAERACYEDVIRYYGAR